MHEQYATHQQAAWPAAELREALTEAAKAGHTVLMNETGTVLSPHLYVLRGGRLVGYVRLRPVYRGQDALTGIAEMSNLAAAASADEVALAWETQDIAAACDHVPLHPGSGINLAVARPGQHTVYRYPYTERLLPGATSDGRHRIAVDWLPEPPPQPQAPLEPAVEGCLQFCWTPLDSSDPNLLDQTADYLEAQGYTVRFTKT